MDQRDFSRCVPPHNPASIPNPLSRSSLASDLKSRNFADPINHLCTNSIIHSPSFTFLVGPKHTKLTIQSGLAQHVSKPLHNLMNNGHTRESRHRIAVLEDEDVETFVAFCEYAYTGDYKVPRLPVPAPLPAPASAPAISPREDTRTRAVESVTSPGPSWRGTYRSDSVSSAVPPPAPSPPPESETDAQTVKAEGEVPSVVEEDVSAEAEAEVGTEFEASPETNAGAGEAAESEVPEQTPTDEAQPPPETDETIEPAEPVEKPSTADWAQYQVSEDVPADIGAQTAPETVERTDSPTWEPASAYSSNMGKSKKKKKDKKKGKKMQTAPLDEEPPARLTPPSTPPPQGSEVVETQDEPVPEPEPVSAEVEDIEAEPVACEEDAPAEIEEAEPEAETEAPAEEPPASYLPSAAPSPSAIPCDDPEWAQPDGTPQEDNTNAKDEDETPEPKSSTSWDHYPTASQTIEEPSSPKPIIDMSFAKQQSDASPRTPGLSLWDEFAALQYNDDTAVPSTLKQSTNSSPTGTTTELPYLTFHAKVYVFATRYLIPALAQLCLRKLHTDLVHLPLGDGNIEEAQAQAQAQAQDYADADADADAHPPTRPGLPGAPAIVLDVLRYAYTKTTRLEPINPTSATQLRENELRRLVVHYAACRVKELARWHGGGSGSATPAVRSVGVGVDGMKPDSLRALLDGTPELASDLVYRMM